MYRLKPEVLDQARQMRGLTSDEQLAEKISVSETTIRHWRHGRKSPSVARLVLLSKLSGMSLDDLLIERDSEHDAA